VQVVDLVIGRELREAIAKYLGKEIVEAMP
jgi:hypothetical protein